MKVLLIRFSAMGDVCMTVPVVSALALQHPGDEFVVLSREAFAPLYHVAQTNVSFRGVDLGKYRGLSGLWALYKELREEYFDVVIDLHNVLRTKILCMFFSLAGVRVSKLHKGRYDKWRLTRRWKKHKKQLPTSFERYACAIRRAGLSVNPEALPHTSNCGQLSRELADLVSHSGLEGGTWIGIAPFAKHEGKIYPTALMMEVISTLSKRPDTKIFLFGGGRKESEALAQWERLYPNTVSCAGRLRLEQEMELIGHLSVMISMDSANMHIASLMGVPVVSIWGATHRYAGFLGWRQKVENCVEEDMPCRPCSVFGNKKCKFNDYRCMKRISPAKIIETVEKCLADDARKA